MVIDTKLDTLLDRIMKVEDRLEQAISSGLQQKVHNNYVHGNLNLIKVYIPVALHLQCLLLSNCFAL